MIFFIFTEINHIEYINVLLCELIITNEKGLPVPLSAVASIQQIEGANQIQRENTKRRIIVGFNVNGRDVQSIMKELQQKINKQLNLQKG